MLNLLNNAKYDKYTGSIINIGLLPFYCMYWTPEQQLLYIARCKRDPEVFLTIDATGGIVKRESSQDSPIFLYQCVFNSKDGSVNTNISNNFSRSQSFNDFFLFTQYYC